MDSTVAGLMSRLGIDVPVIQAPIAGAATPEMVIAVSEAGGLGSLPSAQYSLPDLCSALDRVRGATRRPINVNFFCHAPPLFDEGRQAGWLSLLAKFYEEAGLDVQMPKPAVALKPFDADACSIVEKYRPEAVSFHFGLPEQSLLERVKRTGAAILSSATTVAEARWLADRGVDAIIAMGVEAGGHRGNFLSDDMSNQIGTMALVPLIVAAVKLPVIAAGGIVDRAGSRAAFALGAAAVQAGTAYLFTPEAKISEIYRRALLSRDRTTALTNLLTGRPARGIVNRLMAELGPMSPDVPAFPLAGAMVGPLRAAAEAQGRDDFSSLWAGQAFPLARPMSAAALTLELAGHGD